MMISFTVFRTFLNNIRAVKQIKLEVKDLSCYPGLICLVSKMIVIPASSVAPKWQSTTSRRFEHEGDLDDYNVFVLLIDGSIDSKQLSLLFSLSIFKEVYWANWRYCTMDTLTISLRAPVPPHSHAYDGKLLSKTTTL